MLEWYLECLVHNIWNNTTQSVFVDCLDEAFKTSEAVQIKFPFLCHMQAHRNIPPNNVGTTLTKVHSIFLKANQSRLGLKRQVLKQSVSDKG